jgi:hypothetical protein
VAQVVWLKGELSGERCFYFVALVGKVPELAALLLRTRKKLFIFRV